jgi:hypothetical protein
MRRRRITGLFCVNDSIFSAQIKGDELAAPSLVVNDYDVPEIHWVFWSDSWRNWDVDVHKGSG